MTKGRGARERSFSSGATPAAHQPDNSRNGEQYVLTYNNIMLRHINVKKLHMSILFCTFVVEKEDK